MNFYNPYYYTLPTNLVQPKIGLLGRLFGSTGVSISNFLNGTQKVLNIANQTIPLVKQIKPVVGNAKTVFKVMNEFKRINIPKNEVNISNEITKTNESNEIIETSISDEGPTFFA